jgi:hypothetical protein
MSAQTMTTPALVYPTREDRLQLSRPSRPTAVLTPEQIDRLELPEDTVTILIYAGDAMSDLQWLAGRELARRIAQFPEAIRDLVTRRFVTLAAPLLSKSDETVAEWVRVCQRIPESLQNDPAYTLLRFSHFAEAAHLETLEAIRVALDTAITLCPHRPARASLVRLAAQAVRAGHTQVDPESGRVIAVISDNRDRAPDRPRWRATVERIGGGLGVRLPADARLEPGAAVIVIKVRGET